MINKNILQKQTLFKKVLDDRIVPLYYIIQNTQVIVNGKNYSLIDNETLPIYNHYGTDSKISSLIPRILPLNEKAVIMRPMKDCDYNK